MTNKIESKLHQHFKTLNSEKDNRRPPTLAVLALLITVFSIFIFYFFEDKITKEKEGALSNLDPLYKSKDSTKEKVVKARREESQKFLKEAKKAISQIKKLNLEKWDPEKNLEFNNLLETAQSMHRLQRYAEANKLLSKITKESKEIVSEIPSTLERKLQEGFFALNQGNPILASALFKFVLQIDPKNERANLGMARTNSFDKIQSLIIQAKEFEELGQDKAALRTYQKIINLDNNATEAQHAINRIQYKEKNMEYTKIFKQGQTFLENKQFGQAKKQFEIARNIFPNKREIQNAISESIRAETNFKIYQYMNNAKKAMKSHDWQNAIINYEKVRSLDRNVVEALEGLKHSKYRKELDQQIAEFLRKEEYPIRQKTLEMAKLLKKKIETFKDEPTISVKLNNLNEVIDNMEKKIPFIFISDNKTIIKFDNNIVLGPFKSRAFRLDPGEYSISGKRKGYQDVVASLIVATETKDNRVYIICEEKEGIAN